jgi:hypothetical protein
LIGRESVAVAAILELILPAPGSKVFVKVCLHVTNNNNSVCYIPTRVQVTEVMSPTQFYCTLPPSTDHQITNTDSFMAELQRTYTASARSNTTTAAPAVGELVAARSGRDCTWCRGRVIATEEERVRADMETDVNNNENYINVFFVDHGHTELVEVNSVRKLEERFTLLPFQVMTLFSLPPQQKCDLSQKLYRR